MKNCSGAVYSSWKWIFARGPRDDRRSGGEMDGPIGGPSLCGYIEETWLAGFAEREGGMLSYLRAPEVVAMAAASTSAEGEETRISLLGCVNKEE